MHFKNEPAMTNEISLTFKLPNVDHDPSYLSNAVYGAGFEDVLVGTGVTGVLAVDVTVEDERDAEIQLMTERLIAALPDGTHLIKGTA